jgi:quercetin dioxygenase-like cupin family protein
MEVLERLQERVPETGLLQRIVLFGPETGARHLSSVLVRLPSAHEFPLHTHPVSEDCFFVLSGSGEALEPGRRLPIVATAGVWILAGHPHGLRAGAEGMLEVGFQSPAGHTAVPFGDPPDGDPAPSLLTHRLPSSPPAGMSYGQWASAFPERRAWRCLDAEYSVLEASQSLTVGSGDFESAIVVASGKIALTDPPMRRLPAFSAIRLDPGSSLALQAEASPTLLIAVRARAAA